MKVIGWTHTEDERYPDVKDSIDQASFNSFVEATIEDIRKHNYHFSGSYHQNGLYGVPVFDNGQSLMVSMRTWGKIMADAWPDELNNSSSMGYCNWAWNAPDGVKVVVPGGGACL